MNNEQAVSPTIPRSDAPKALRVFATVISYVCHPVFVPLVMAIVLMKLSPESFSGVSAKQRGEWLLSIGFTTLFFPLFSVALMKPLGFISSFKMPTTKDRIIPLITSMIFYFWVYNVFNNVAGVPFIYKTFFLANFIGIIAVFMFNIFTKVSMHTAGAGTMVGILTVLMLINPAHMLLPLLVSIVVAAVIGFARLVLGEHTRGDVWLGYILGILPQLCVYWYQKP
ncbi:MAG: hypothetical protein V4649_11265 [Bacteroidota bacterium]